MFTRLLRLIVIRKRWRRGAPEKIAKAEIGFDQIGGARRGRRILD